MNRIDKRIRNLVERLDAEEVTVAITYDRNSWWTRRGKGRLPWSVRIAWEDRGEKFLADGDVDGGSIERVLDAVEAEVNGVLVRQRAGVTDA